MNKDLKFYYLPLLPEAEPICRFTARVNRKFVFTSFLEKKPAFLSSTTAWWECCLMGVLRWVWETGMSFSHVKHTDK